MGAAILTLAPCIVYGNAFNGARHFIKTFKMVKICVKVSFENLYWLGHAPTLAFWSKTHLFGDFRTPPIESHCSLKTGRENVRNSVSPICILVLTRVWWWCLHVVMIHA